MIYWPCRHRKEVFVQRNLSTWQAIAVATQFGFTLAVAVGLGIFVGNAIDARLGLHNAPVFTLLGVFAGLASAIVGTIQMMRSFIQRNNASAERDKEP